MAADYLNNSQDSLGLFFPFPVHTLEQNFLVKMICCIKINKKLFDTVTRHVIFNQSFVSSCERTLCDSSSVVVPVLPAFVAGRLRCQVSEAGGRVFVVVTLNTT